MTLDEALAEEGLAGAGAPDSLPDGAPTLPPGSWTQELTAAVPPTTCCPLGHDRTLVNIRTPFQISINGSGSVLVASRGQGRACP